MFDDLLKIAPNVRQIKLNTEPDMYGASYIISQQLKLPFRPASYAYWQHGWIYAPLKYCEQFGLPFSGVHLVATKEEEDFLKKNGKTAFAVGAPFIYANKYDSFNVIRRANSLLVMPPHGASYTKKKWNESEYIDSIATIRKDYEFIAACISPSDIEKGDWLQSFNKLGVKCIAGASMHDRNALFRMNRFFKYFEYVTTNSIGSHVAYAGYCGAKVSIYGPYDYHDESSLNEDILYKNNRSLLEYAVEMSSSTFVYKNHGELFFDHPSHAVNIELSAHKWLGGGGIRRPINVARLLGWYPEQQIYNYSARVFRKIRKETGNIFGGF